jgi:GxxExxY protein
MPTKDELNDLAYLVRGAGLRVHQKLGPGCFESAYVPCFAYELRQLGIQFRAKVPLTLRYETVVVPRAYELDFLIAAWMVIEVKALEKLAPVHSRQLDTYLKLTGCPIGFIFNFGAPNFLGGVVRRVNAFPEGSTPLSTLGDEMIEADY